MKRFLSVAAVAFTLLLGACAEMPNTSAGAGIGAVLGAVVSPNDPAAGAILGGVGGAAIGNIFDRNNQGRGYDDGRRYDCRGCGNSGGYYRRDNEYYVRMERQRRFEQQRAYEEQMRQRRWEEQRRWEDQQRYNRRDCYRCGW